MNYTLRGETSGFDLFIRNIGNGSITLGGKSYSGTVHFILYSGDGKLGGIRSVLFITHPKIMLEHAKIGSMSIQNSEPLTIKYWK